MKKEHRPLWADKSFPILVRLRDFAEDRRTTKEEKELLTEAIENMAEERFSQAELSVSKEDQTVGYAVVSSEGRASLAEMIEETDKWVKKGWIPAGGPYHSGADTWCQALYRTGPVIVPGKGESKPRKAEGNANLPAIYEGMSTQGMLENIADYCDEVSPEWLRDVLRSAIRLINAQKQELRKANDEVQAVLDDLGTEYIRMREGGGAENIYGSLAISVARMKYKLEKPL